MRCMHYVPDIHMGKRAKGPTEYPRHPTGFLRYVGRRPLYASLCDCVRGPPPVANVVDFVGVTHPPFPGGF